ncbi:MAG: cation transporter [Bryobacteraceae bacterium]|nr:cation diffusion facilitator family transporter [Bryobacterales bacterium]MEB2362617.1 cation diffusion facilitator family transporter [Bryobacterales bacterium]NUN01562.1 cation transporter [Bryobacteraceae bacterium]
MHSHTHHQYSGSTGRYLKWSLVLTTVYVVVEVFAGVAAHSLALIADAGHNITDALALGIAALGYHLQGKPADSTKTWGYHRAGVLAAFVNAGTLVLLSAYIFYESYQRLRNPEPVGEFTMIVVAATGLVLNLLIMHWMRAEKEHDLNIRAAFLHMLGDALGSVAIIVGAVTIRYTGWLRIDPILSILIGGLIIWSAWDVFKESMNILLEGLPRGVELSAVASAMKQVDGVIDVHDLHIWSLGSSAHALSSHVVIADLPPSESDRTLRSINDVLAAKFHINHTTIQFEHVECSVSKTGCSIPVRYEEHRH